MLKAIKTEAEYEQVMAKISALLDLNPDEDTPENGQLDLLILLAEDYETKHASIPSPTPLEAIRFRMEQEGLL